MFARRNWLDVRKWNVQINSAGGHRGRVLGSHALNYTCELFRVWKWMSSGMTTLLPTWRIAEKPYGTE